MGKNLTIVGIGELLWDVYGESKENPGHISKRAGGAPANQAFHANQMGAKGIVISAVGDDDLGSELLDFVKENNLDASFVQTLPGVKTGWVEVDLSQGEPKYTIHQDVAWDQIAYVDGLDGVLSNVDAVCFGTLAQRSEASRSSIQKVLQKAKGALKVFDINLRQSFYDKDLVEAGLKIADVVKLNDQECILLKPLLGMQSEQPQAFAGELITKYNTKVVCVTMADKGCMVVTKDQQVTVPGKKVDVVSPVGAGDAFTAAFVWAYLNNWSLDQAAGFANDVGALVCEHKGAMPFIANEVDALKLQWSMVSQQSTKQRGVA